MTDTSALTLAKTLIAAPSVTPARGPVFDALEGMLTPLGFTVERFVAGEGEAEGPVENLFAIREGTAGASHFAYAGHLDVVPPGEDWASDPFAPDLRGDLLYGRGAVDMKGSVAAFVAALYELPRDLGTISLIITGDEEGPARFGTVKLIDHMRERGSIPDLCLVGEPTSVTRLGDMVKIGRRGSVNMTITVEGTQGHVAYPHLADNPVPKLVAILSEIDALTLDEGTDWFQPSNIEITTVDVGNPTENLIPGSASARISIRFNDRHSGESLVALIEEIVTRGGGTLRPRISGEPFLTEPGAFSDLLTACIQDITGLSPELSTSGGTSDARFLSKLCPCIEFGLNNATMHKVDEAVAAADLAALAKIYTLVVQRALDGQEE